MNALPTQTSEPWHLDRRIPIATLLALALQVFAVIWFASAMDRRVTNLEEYTNEMRSARLRERLAVEEAGTVSQVKRFEQLDVQLDRLEDKLDHIAEKLDRRR